MDSDKADMRQRCEEQGHAWENCCSAMLQVYERCKWCGAVRYCSRQSLALAAAEKIVSDT